MKDIEVYFYKGKKRVFNRLVSWWTGGKYSHVEILLDGLSYSSSTMDGGVRAKQIDFNDGNWDKLIIKGFDPVKAKQWFIEHDSAKYDYAGLFGFIFRVFQGQEGKYFCSEAVGESLGIQDAWRYCPNTLHSALNIFK